MLIDNSTSHNFISSGVVIKPRVTAEKTKKFKVIIGDGYKVQGDGICKGVELELKGTRIRKDFYLFDLGEADLF